MGCFLEIVKTCKNFCPANHASKVFVIWDWSTLGGVAQRSGKKTCRGISIDRLKGMSGWLVSKWTRWTWGYVWLSLRLGSKCFHILWSNWVPGLATCSRTIPRTSLGALISLKPSACLIFSKRFGSGFGVVTPITQCTRTTMRMNGVESFHGVCVEMRGEALQRFLSWYVLSNGWSLSRLLNKPTWPGSLFRILATLVSWYLQATAPVG